MKLGMIDNIYPQQNVLNEAIKLGRKIAPIAKLPTNYSYLKKELYENAYNELTRVAEGFGPNKPDSSAVLKSGL